MKKLLQEYKEAIGSLIITVIIITLTMAIPIILLCALQSTPNQKILYAFCIIASFSGGSLLIPLIEASIKVYKSKMKWKEVLDEQEQIEK